jgi:putative NADH-flavin reductase
MVVTVFGANGKVGSIVVEQLLEQGHHVKAFVHSASHFEPHPNLEIIKGDIYSAKQVADSIKGSKAVISALGSWGTSKKDILFKGMKNIVPAMQQNNIVRIVSLTGSAAQSSGDKFSVINMSNRALLGLFAKKILIDGEKHIKLLEDSGLNWTVVRSPVMNNKGDATKYCLLDKAPKPWGTINRQSVAISLVELLTNVGYKQKAPYIVRD